MRGGSEKQTKTERSTKMTPITLSHMHICHTIFKNALQRIQGSVGVFMTIIAAKVTKYAAKNHNIKF